MRSLRDRVHSSPGHQTVTMVYEISYQKTAGKKAPHSKTTIHNVCRHIPIYWERKVENSADIKAVGEALKEIQFDRREINISLKLSYNSNVAPFLPDLNLTLKTIVMCDLRRLTRLGHIVTVSINVI